MTPRQKEFCEHYAESGNATQAARAAGFSEKTAYSTGQRLLKNVEVMKYIRQLQDEAAQSRLMSVVRVKAYLSEVIQNTEEKTTDRLKAADMFLRCAGAFLHFKPDPETEWRIAAGEAGGEDVVIYLPAIERIEDAEMPEEETEDD